MQPNAPELENAGETVYDEIDESLLAPGYENWTDLNRFMQTVLENPELSVEQRDRKSTRLNSSHGKLSRMPSSA